MVFRDVRSRTVTQLCNDSSTFVYFLHFTPIFFSSPIFFLKCFSLLSLETPSIQSEEAFLLFVYIQFPSFFFTRHGQNMRSTTNTEKSHYHICLQKDKNGFAVMFKVSKVHCHYPIKMNPLHYIDKKFK